MDGVAAEIAKEIGVFLEDFHAYSRSSQQQPEHHARRSATGDADLTPQLASCSHAQMPRSRLISSNTSMSAASCSRPVRLEAMRCSIDAAGTFTPSTVFTVEGVK